MLKTLFIALVTLGLSTSVLAGLEEKAAHPKMHPRQGPSISQQLKLEGDRAAKLDALEKSFYQEQLEVREKHQAKLAEVLT